MAINRVLGRELLKKKLAALPKAVRGNVQAALTGAAEAIANQQRALVPVDTGVLKSTIEVTPFSRGGIGAVITAGGAATTVPVREGQSASYDRALAVELGTQDMLAEPFFYPAFRRGRAGARRKASSAVRKAVAAGAGIK